MAKGIRVNQLAKELGVESKAILAKCREEGLGDKVPNHMTVLSIGLSETVREWFHGLDSGGGGGTAVETAPPVEVKPKKSRTIKKKGTDEDTEPTEGEESHEESAEQQATEAPTEVVQAPAEPPMASTAAPVAEAPPEAQKPAPAEHVEPEPAAATAAPAAPAMEPLKPVAPPRHEPPAAPEIAPHVPLAPAAAAATAAPHAAPKAPAHPQAPGAHRPPLPTARPTVTLKQGPGSGPATIERREVIPAPQLTLLKPAQMQGPKVVRVEAPESIPVPRGPRRPAGSSDEPAFTQARPQQGRGVKVSEEEEDEAKKKAKAAASRTNSNRRRGPDGRRGEAHEKLKEFTEADLEERRIRLNRAAGDRAQRETKLIKTQHRGQGIIAKTGLQRGEPIQIEEPITVKSLSAALGVKSSDIQSRLAKQGIFAVVNQGLDRETAEMIALEYGAELIIAQQSTLEETLVAEFEEHEPVAEKLIPRPPVVTILGHVDHGKTSLLDRIRKANVAAGEAGGITQHTAAWMVQLGEGESAKRVTFIDTPGHQAFTSMRARGANMTDVVVLVVSAAEGVQPQTIESINHARAANVPIVVAMNKIDRPDANEQQVLGQLAGQNLNPVEWGGDIEVIRTSATTGKGIEELIEILDYQSQLLDLKTDPTAPARGTVIESRMEPGLGAVATVLIQDGTLRPGDAVLVGSAYGRVRMLLNDRGESIPAATASVPVVVGGLNALPNAGDKAYQVSDFDRARAIAEERVNLLRQQELVGRNQVTTRDNLTDVIRAGETKTIHLIIKGDVQGSVETLAKSVTDMNTDEVRVKVIHSGVGGINESDVELAMATRVNPEDKDNPNQVAIIGFHVIPDESARALAEQNHIDIKLYRIIYEIFDDLKKALSGMLEPELREKLHGHAEVRQVFKVSRIGNIAGCLVTDGHIQRGSKIRLTRGGVVITEDLTLESLKRLKDDVREVKSGLECGIKIAGYDDIKVGDVLEAYIRETIQRTL
ncbi:MAG TPA: translation initiation factor IF-2 [Humisphaera sp.]|nr:translation initiation factor IF-2 [Humisphaera sp.]